MAVNKKVQIDFADPSIKAIDHLHDLRDAVRSASLSLNLRRNIVLQYPMPENDRVVLEIRMPEDEAESFVEGKPYGMRLRGISNYLLKECGGRYQRYLVGNRLLTYTLLDGSDNNKTQSEHRGFTMPDRLDAITAFAKLLKRTDEESLDRIERILTILNEDNTDDMEE